MQQQNRLSKMTVTINTVDNNNNNNNKLNNKQQDDKPRTNTYFHHVGYLLIALGGLLAGSMFFGRSSISVAILNMVNQTHLYLMEHPNATLDEIPPVPANNKEQGEFNWTNERQQFIISIQMVSYTLPQFFAGQLGHKFGVRSTLSLSIILCGLSSLLVPVLVHQDWRWIVVLRVLNGASASGVIPITLIFIERWFNEQDAPKAFSVFQFASINIYFMIPLLSGLLTSIHWQWAFYAPGVMCLVFGLIWYLLVRTEPTSSRLLSQKELDRIHQRMSSHGGEEKEEAKRVVAWYEVLKLKSFWMFIVVWTLKSILEGSAVFLLPSYLKKAYNMSIEENGFYNFITQIGLPVAMLWQNPTVSFMQKRYGLTLTEARQIIVLLFLYVALYHQHQILVLAIFRFFHTGNELLTVVTMLSQYGRYGLTGTVVSLLNTVGMFLVAIYCWAVGRLLDLTGESFQCWSWVFGSMALINVVIFILYYLFLPSEPVEFDTSNAANAQVDDGGDGKRCASQSVSYVTQPKD